MGTYNNYTCEGCKATFVAKDINILSKKEKQYYKIYCQECYEELEESLE